MQSQLLTAVMAYFLSSIVPVPISNPMRLRSFHRGFTGDLGDMLSDSQEAAAAADAESEQQKPEGSVDSAVPQVPEALLTQEAAQAEFAAVPVQVLRADDEGEGAGSSASGCVPLESGAPGSGKRAALPEASAEGESAVPEFDPLNYTGKRRRKITL